MPKAHQSVANKGNILVRSAFNGYDLCLNPYVGCAFACSYCYVREFVKDKDHEWGEFVRLRLHLEEKLPRELAKGEVKLSKSKATGEVKKIKITDARLVIGTMTDPYQAAEAKRRLTRTALEIITNPSSPQFTKVGIFTRSPLVLTDLDLIALLPKARVHFTVTPYPTEVMRALEPYSARTEVRWKIIKQLKETGLRVHVNVAPVMPNLSEPFIDEFAQRLAELKVDEWFWDPMQAYDASFEAFKRACNTTSLNWADIERTMTDAGRYAVWKLSFLGKLKEAWEKVKHLAPDAMPIWSDHANKVWLNLNTGQQMSKRYYND